MLGSTEQWCCRAKEEEGDGAARVGFCHVDVTEQGRGDQGEGLQLSWEESCGRGL